MDILILICHFIFDEVWSKICWILALARIHFVYDVWMPIVGIPRSLLESLPSAEDFWSFDFLVAWNVQLSGFIGEYGYTQEQSHILSIVVINLIAVLLVHLIHKLGQLLVSKLISNQAAIRMKTQHLTLYALMPSLYILQKLIYLAVRLLQPIIYTVAYLIGAYDKFVFGPRVVPIVGGPPMRTGYVRWNKKDFFRHEDGSISKCRLKGILTTKDTRGFEKTHYDCEIIEETGPPDLSPGESILQGVPVDDKPSKLEKGNVLIYDTDFNYFSAGVVIENILVMCRHKSKSHSHIVVKGTNSSHRPQVGVGAQNGVLIDLKRAHTLDDVPMEDGLKPKQWDEERHTCTLLDFMAIPLEKDEVSMIGVKTFREKDVCRNYELQRASIKYATDDFGTVIKGEGSLPEADQKVHDLGLALAKINSRYGASSSAVSIVQGGIKLVGMWLGKPAHSLEKLRDTRNLFMHADAIMANLEHLGLLEPSLLTQLHQWGENVRTSLEEAGWKLSEGAESKNSASPSPGESREDKRTRQARKFKEFYEALEREQLYRESLDQDDGDMDDEEIVHAINEMNASLARTALLRHQGPGGRKNGESMPSDVFFECEDVFFECDDTLWATSLLDRKKLNAGESKLPGGPGQCRIVQPLIKLPLHVAAPLPTDSLKSKTINSLSAEVGKGETNKCQYFNIGEACETESAPPGLEFELPGNHIFNSAQEGVPHHSSVQALKELREEARERALFHKADNSVPAWSGLPLQQILWPDSNQSRMWTPPATSTAHSLDDVIKAWKYEFLYGDVSSVLADIEEFSVKVGGNVRNRLAAVFAAESFALLRDYVKKVSPMWEAGDEKLAKHGDQILDRDESFAYFRKIGSYPPSRLGKQKKKPAEETKLQVAIRDLANRYFQEGKHGCVKGEFTIPAGTKSNIHKSLNAQARMATASAPNLTPEQATQFRAAVDLVKKKYSEGIGGAKITSYLEEGERGLLKTFLGFEDKSSGASARYRNLKKSVWANAYTEEVADLALSRMILIAVAGDQLYDLTAVELIELGCSDAKELFPKQEGHSPQKTEECRYRLIWISSLIDLTVQSLLHKADNAAHTDAYQSGTLTCAALGMGHSDDNLKHLVKAFYKEGVAEKNISCDASAFDLSIDSSFIFADGERRSENCGCPYVGKLIQRYAHVLCSHVLNNQGDVWLVCKYGVTTSGQLSTSTQNTFARSVQAAYAGCKGWVCSGDDLVGDTGFDAKRLLHFGVRSRDLAYHELVADFTSHMIDVKTSTAVFGNVEKMLWHLHHDCTDVSTNRERFGGSLQVLRNTPGALEDLTAIADEFKIQTEGYVDDTTILRDLA